ncbi:MAG: beta-N-acetylhexosaminidase [Gammaproteobacteria bacterium]
MSLGPIMLDLRGTRLEADERDMLMHHLTGGVVLFSRNFESQQQITELINSIHRVREPRLLVAVDQEGGRVQRFREGFTPLPACRLIGAQYNCDPGLGVELAEMAGWVMAAELRAVGADFSFAPILDLDRSISNVIGDRAFHKDPEVVTLLAQGYMRGMKRAGMAAVGKHFPGHGSVAEDSHHTIPVDNRRYEDIQMEDQVPFERMIHAGLAAIMPAHVIYREIDDKPAGFSPVWLKGILRHQLGFQGTIFSDDINMAGAGVAGDYVDRAKAALDAGCDMVVVCNNQQGAADILNRLDIEANPQSQARLIRMHGRHEIEFGKLKQEPEWQSISARIAQLDTMPELDLGDDVI